MSRNLIFAPILAHVCLVIGLYVALAVAKKRAAARGLVDEIRRALFDDAWPTGVLQINNSIRNQFEVPVLFYACSFVLWGLDAVGVVALSVAWAFVVSRLVHTTVHTTSNHVPTRRWVFTIGCVLVLVMVGLCVVKMVAGWPS